ncbi:MAG: acid stress-induced BolA-like protein IbaG/YrbA [Myxococcota bacterium]|jgi:acid stress-induced BolA-like protein IbaG/YrbA
MSFNISDPTTDLCREMERLLQDSIDGAKATVAGNGGHFEITVVASAFEGKSMLEQQRMVYGPITPLMTGGSAPVHAIDRMNLSAS